MQQPHLRAADQYSPHCCCRLIRPFSCRDTVAPVMERGQCPVPLYESQMSFRTGFLYVTLQSFHLIPQQQDSPNQNLILYQLVNYYAFSYWTERQIVCDICRCYRFSFNCPLITRFSRLSYLKESHAIAVTLKFMVLICCSFKKSLIFN